MAYPDEPELDYSYTAFQQSQGNNDFPGTQLDNDLAELDRSITDVIAYLQTALRSDGQLNNGIVTVDSLSPEVLDLIDSATGGAAGVPEAPNDGKQYGRQSLNWTEIVGGGGGGGPLPETEPPAMNGAANAGVDADYSRGDHVHPTDTTRAAASHTHAPADITDFIETLDDRVSSLLTAGSNIVLSYNDAAGILTISSTAVGVTDTDKGDITVTNSGATWTIDANAVGNSKLAQMAAFTLKANNTNGLAAPTDINIAALGSKAPAGTDLLLLSDTSNGGILRQIPISSLPGATSIGEAPTTPVGSVYTRRGSDASWVLAGGLADGTYGDIRIESSGTTLTVINDAISFAKMQNIATDTLIGRDTAGLGDPENITLGVSLSMNGSQVLQRAALTGDVTAPVNSNATTIAAGVVTNAKLTQVTAPVFKGRVTTGLGDVEDMTATQATSMLNLFTSTLKGLVPLSGGGTANFLRADGSWQPPASTGQPLDTFLTSIAALGTAADKIIYTTAVDTAAETPLTAFARTLLDDADAATMRATIGASDPTTLLSTDNTWSGIQGYAEAAIGPGTPVTWNVDAAPVATLALAGNTTMNAPTNVVAGRVYDLRIVQNATSTVTWATAFKFAGGTVPVVSSGANKVDCFSFIGRGTNLEEIGRSQAIA